MYKKIFLFFYFFIFLFSCNGMLTMVEKRDVPKLEEMANFAEGAGSYSSLDEEDRINGEFIAVNEMVFIPFTEILGRYFTDLKNRSLTTSAVIDLSIRDEKISITTGTGDDKKENWVKCDKFILKGDIGLFVDKLFNGFKLDFKKINANIKLDADIDLSFNDMVFDDTDPNPNNKYAIKNINPTTVRYYTPTRVQSGYIKGRAKIYINLAGGGAAIQAIVDKSDEYKKKYDAYDNDKTNKALKDATIAAEKELLETLFKSLNGRIYAEFGANVLWGATVDYQMFDRVEFVDAGKTKYKKENIVKKGVIIKNEIIVKPGRLPVAIDFSKHLLKNKDKFESFIDAKYAIYSDATLDAEKKHRATTELTLDMLFNVLGETFYRGSKDKNFLTYSAVGYDAGKKELFNFKLSNTPLFMDITFGK